MHVDKLNIRKKRRKKKRKKKETTRLEKRGNTHEALGEPQNDQMNPRKQCCSRFQDWDVLPEKVLHLWPRELDHSNLNIFNIQAK